MSGKSFSSDVRKRIEKAIAILSRGGLVAFPTDTVYGLGAGMNIPEAIERVYRVKKRPRNMALPLLLADTSQIAKVAESVPPIAWLLVERFLPGALTLVLRKSSLVPNTITAGSANVAIRIPAHPVPVALVRGLGMPIVGTSANLSGQRSPLTAAEVYSQLGDEVEMIIDVGKCPVGKESTVVDVTGEKPIVIRQGAISIEELRRVFEVV